MPEKDKIIMSYILDEVDKLKNSGIVLPQDQIDNIFKQLIESDESIEKIKEQIDKKINSLLYLGKRQDITKDVSDMTSLSIPYKGITLNNQDIDLLMIANTKTKEELNTVISKIENLKGIKFDFKDDIISLKEKVFKKYLDILVSKEEYFKDKKINILKKLEYLKRSSFLTEEEIQIILNIIFSCKDTKDIMDKMNSNFSQEKVHSILKMLKNFSPIEKSGIKSSTIETYQNLYNLLSSYNSITIDEEIKYNNVTLQDGTFDFTRLKKAFDYVKSLGDKKVRLNALIFYKDCPKELSTLEINDENKKIVKDKLIKYVDETTKFIANNGYEDVVRSIDVFNELLNRFPMEGSTTYCYRGDILNGDKNDNTASFWLKYLTIEDLCEIIYVARKNLPNVEFCLNEDNLTDPNKIDFFIDLVKRIQYYSKNHNIKLIDTIGSEMHINNDVSKEQIENMLYKLSILNLPIEVTEFDMALSNVDGLSLGQIERLRQRKINEIYSVIDSLKDKCNITGFTIWSKTDKQNFRVSLENEKRIKEEKEPIETLYGGLYKNNMRPKCKIFSKDISPNYNYHTHTKRCGHAKIVDDDEYVLFARKAGITQLGFSDHIPCTPYELPNASSRMYNSELQDYIKSVENLKEENKDMTILCGLEAEYEKVKESYLSEIRNKVDYLILGQHYVNKGLTMVPQKNNSYYPLEYAFLVCEALDSGLFDIVAHPDIFMQYRDSFETEEEKKRFIKNAIVASRMICEKAKEVGVPLEINFGGVSSSMYLSDGELKYPHSLFWKIASEIQPPVLYGVDAHSPSSLIERDFSRNKICDVINTLGLNFVSFDYNPVEARKRNKKIQDLLAKNKMNSLSYEASYVNEVLSGIIPKISNSANSETIFEMLNKLVDLRIRKLLTMSTYQDEKIFKDIESISRNDNIDKVEKRYRLERLRKLIEEVNSAVQKESSFLEKVKDSIVRAKEIGCSVKEEYKDMIVQFIEEKTETNEEKKLKASSEIASFKNKKKLEAIPKKEEKPKMLIFNGENANLSNLSQGFVKIFSILMMLVGFLGIISGIVLFISSI